MNDFRQIKFGGKLLQVEEFNWMHEICIGFIRKNIEESTANHIVVVTHHLPTLQVVAAHHRGSVLNNAFASDYDNLIANSRIDAWIYGHSRTNIDTEIGGTRVISNQMGYIFANVMACTFSVSIFVPPSGASMCSVYHASGLKLNK